MSRWIILAAAVALLVYNLILFSQRSGTGVSAYGSDPKMVNLAVRATVNSMPTQTPLVVEVTRVLEVTRIVEVTRVVEVTRAPEPTATPTATPTPIAAQPAPVAIAAAAVPESGAAIQNMPETVAVEAEVAVERAAAPQSAGCPTTSANQYATVPIPGPAAEHPDTLHGDLNLSLRGYAPVEVALTLVSINGPTDGDPPQLGTVLGRAPSIAAAYRVNEWNWGCGQRGCQGGAISHVKVSLIALAASAGDPLRIASRGAEVYGGGYKVVVLFADENQVTLTYTREDTVANGYALHLAGICTDPNLLSAYRHANAMGRGSLPALRDGEVLGSAAGNAVLVAIRDRGMFTDPRSRKDWWRGH